MMFFRQRRFVFLSLIGLLSVLLIAKFVAPLYLRAQTAQQLAQAVSAAPASAGADNVGSNVGEGDITTQVDIINNVIAPNGAGPGYPVTVLMYENSPAEDVQKVANAIKSHGFFPIVRIDKTCDYSAAESGVIVGLVKQYFGADTVIAFGNEINNKDTECSDWGVYERNFRSVQGGNISPSAIDFYMGNPLYQYDKLPGSLRGAIDGSGIRAANAYGCIGAKASSCDDNAMKTYLTGLTGTDGKKLYVTEFSLSPGDKSPDVPDTDLAKVISFIQKYSPQVHAEKITPLIRNVCSSPEADGQWLIYVKGQIFTKHGRNVTKSCANLKNPYYEFNIQRENSQGILNNFTDEYSVACLPKEEYKLGFENDPQKCGTDPKHVCPANWQSWNIPGKLKITADGKTYGVYRNEAAVTARTGTNNAPSRTESVEAYLSTPNEFEPKSGTSIKSGGSVSTKQAPIYSLYTLEQQCGFVVDKLKAVHELCKPENRLELYTKAGETTTKDNGEACGLNTSVTGTSVPYDQDSLLSAFNSRGQTCKELADPNATADNQKFLEDLLKVNVSMETAYRPAFIVAVTTFDDPKSTDNVTTHTASDKGVEPVASGKFQVVDYLEVRIPAIATDFLPAESTDHSSSLVNPDRNNYKDPIRLTADAFWMTDERETYDKKQITDRIQLRANTGDLNGPIIGNNGNMPIFCNVNGELIPNCDSPARTGTDYLDQIPQALVKFINGSAKTESQGTWDQLPCRSFEAEIYGKENVKQIAEQGQTILAQLKSQDIGPYQKRKNISTNLSVVVKDVTKGGAITTNTELYFVTPQRYELQYAQQGMLSFLSKADQLGYLNVSQVTKEVFDPSRFSPLLKSDLNKALTGREVKTGGFDITYDTQTTPPVTTGTTTIPGTTTTVENHKPFDLIGLVNDASDHPYSQGLFWKVAGQVASLPTRMLALLTSLHGSPINDYTEGCQGNHATEDWLTGKCLRAQDYAPASVPDPSAGTPGNMCIETKIADQATLDAYGAKLKSYLSIPTTLNFWDRYFGGFLPGAPVLLFSNKDSRCNLNGTCYDLVIDTAIQHHINPYLAIAIALNETGGFRSNQPDGSGRHFGCGVAFNPNEGTIGNGLIPDKLKCMVGAFDSYANQGLSADAAMKKYGYPNGVKEAHLAKIINFISNNSYAGVCEQTVE